MNAKCGHTCPHVCAKFAPEVFGDVTTDHAPLLPYITFPIPWYHHLGIAMILSCSHSWLLASHEVHHNFPCLPHNHKNPMAGKLQE